MKPLKEKISITIDNDILEAIKLQAEQDDRSLSQYINIVLKQHVKDKATKNKPWRFTACFYFNIHYLTLIPLFLRKATNSSGVPDVKPVLLKI